MQVQILPRSPFQQTSIPQNSLHNMANHRITEHHFRRIEDTLVMMVKTVPPTKFALRPPEGHQATSLCNDLSIGLKAFLKRGFASVKLQREDAAAFSAGYVLRVDIERNLVVVAERLRRRGIVEDVVKSINPERVVNNGDDGETQLAQNINVTTPLGRRLVIAAATLFNSNYLTSPVTFRGHVDHDLDVELRSVYPDVCVLNETHPIYGPVVVIL